MNTVHPDPSPAPTQTYGEKAVGLSFNPSGSDAVIRCKRRFAGAIDQMNDLRLITTDTHTHTHTQERGETYSESSKN